LFGVLCGEFYILIFCNFEKFEGFGVLGIWGKPPEGALCAVFFLCSVGEFKKCMNIYFSSSYLYCFTLSRFLLRDHW
jgi:hypothetical protein